MNMSHTFVDAMTGVWSTLHARMLADVSSKHGVANWAEIERAIIGFDRRSLMRRTQRMLGRQAVNEYIGFPLDVSAVKTDNDRLAGVSRDADGIIIADRTLRGSALVSAREANRARYGLSAEAAALLRPGESLRPEEQLRFESCQAKHILEILRDAQRNTQVALVAVAAELGQHVAD